jgi:hypothetical protein
MKAKTACRGRRTYNIVTARAQTHANRAAWGRRSQARILAMSKTKIHWAKTPTSEDYDAAHDYLSLIFPKAKCDSLLKSLRAASTVVRTGKDLLRASNLPLLPRDDPHVDEQLKRIHKGKSLSPILLISGDVGSGVPLVVADGHHRICALFYVDESEPVVCQMAPIGAR